MEHSEKEPTGPTCLYKGNQVEVYEGDAVAKALKDGWKDKPPKAKN